MRRTHQHLSGHAERYALCAGIAVFLAGLLGTVAIVAQYQQQRQAPVQDKLVQRLEEVAGESSSLLARLNVDFEPLCTPGTLVRLRNLMFDTRYVRDIGLVNEDGAVFCSTGRGLWERPFVPPHDQLHARRIPGAETRYTQYDTPSRIGGGRHRTTIVWQDAFNLVVDPFVLGDLFNPRTHLLWFQLPGGDLQRIGTDTYPARESLRQLLRSEAQQVHAQPRAGFSWREWSFVRTQRAPQSELIVQTQVPLADVLSDQAPTLLLLLGFSALLGVLTSVALLQRLTHLGSLDARIGRLVTAEHLRCLYQPIVDIHTGQPVGCEVLMRIDDAGQTLMPEATIPVIMRQGLTWELDRAIMLKGLAELASCPLPPGGFRVAFNLFPQNIRFREIHALLAPLRGQLKAAGLQIDLEVTEHNYDREVIAEIDQLKAAGYQVSVDDFGTGYSNLGSIKRFAPHYLKIDKSFVFDMEDASIRSSLIPEIVGIGKAVGAMLVAEGVENLRQVQQLRAYGVQYAQGYFYARPLTLDALRHYLAESAAAAAPTLATAPAQLRPLPG